MPGIDTVEWLIINDGSADRTVDVAWPTASITSSNTGPNSGLAKVFMAGLDACLRLGADIIVNTDADNQYAPMTSRSWSSRSSLAEPTIVSVPGPISEIPNTSPHQEDHSRSSAPGRSAYSERHRHC